MSEHDIKDAYEQLVPKTLRAFPQQTNKDDVLFTRRHFVKLHTVSKKIPPVGIMTHHPGSLGRRI